MIICLTGGYGGVRFMLGLVEAIKDELAIICNVGDDIELYGLRISPDIDTVIYGLSGLLDESRTWGVKGDSFNFLQQFRIFSNDVWFSIGDKDLAIHVYRTWRLKNGDKLSKITFDIKNTLNIEQIILPCTDDLLQTFIETTDGKIMHYQEFFVRYHTKPNVSKVYYCTESGMHSADDVLLNNNSIVSPSEGLLDMLEKARKVIICPSNPVASIGPILAVEGIRDLLEEKEVIAISPMVKNLPVDNESIRRRITAQKKLLEAIGYEHTPFDVAKLYNRFLDIFFLDVRDSNYLEDIKNLGVEVILEKIIPNSPQDRMALVKKVLEVLE